MKKRLLYAVALLVIATAFTGCEGLLNNCKICRLNTYEDGVLIQSLNEAEYCDADLISIQAQPAEYGDGTVTKWECD